MEEAPVPVEVFCSYARKDETWRQDLETHLSLLKRQGLVSLWHNRLITPGTDWAKTIDTHLETASVILLLVSAHFFASDYCYGIEMKRALERQKAGKARVIPILVSPTDRKDAPFAHLQALPTDTKPLSTQRNKDAALADVVASIRCTVEELSLPADRASHAVLPAKQNILYSKPIIWRAIIGLVLVVAIAIGGFVWRALTPSVPVSPTQTLATFCKDMIHGQKADASLLFTSRGLQDFQPSQRKSYSSCTYDPIPTPTDRTVSVSDHLVVTTAENHPTYAITLTLRLDGTSWKIDSWVSSP